MAKGTDVKSDRQYSRGKGKGKNPIKLPFDGINFDPVWEFPVPDGELPIQKRQQDFLNEYIPTGHKIFDRTHYPDLTYIGKERVAEGGRTVIRNVIMTRKVRRIPFAIQKQTVDIFMAHYLGNSIKFEDITFKDKYDEELKLYKDIWETKNMESVTYTALKHSYIVAHSAIYLYRQDKQIKGKVYSFMNGDRIAVSKDIYGDITTLWRKYQHVDDEGQEKTYVDKIDKQQVVTYDQEGNIVGTPINHGFGVAPFAYFHNPNGTLWQFCQQQIEDLELDFSMLAEDNKTKTKSKHFMTTEKPSQVKVESVGGADVIIGGINDDLKMIAGAEISSQFKFVHEALVEQIQNTLGIVFPKHKSSGDMPTGSMKMIFYPTERVVMGEIHHHNESLDTLNKAFKKMIELEVKREYDMDIKKIKIRASFDLFTPQDRSSKVKDIIDLRKSGLLSKRQSTNEISSLNIGNNANYEELLQEQKEDEAKETKKLQDADKLKSQQTKIEFPS